MSCDLEIEVQGERLRLMAERAVYWEQRETLLVADLHWGKAATLRAAAIPVPHGTTDCDLARLSQALERSGARRLVLLGDVLHARKGRAVKTLASVAAWRRGWPDLEILMVRGNHDRGAGDPPEELGIRCAEGPVAEGPFVYRHEPQGSEDGYTLAGHWHPGIRLRGLGGMKATLACFYFTEKFGVLPAFGSLTGLGVVSPVVGERVYGIAEGEVIGVV